ncbi:tail fiber protein [Escherichia phage KBNP1711]|uniref:Putative tail fiber protein n=1 Tax=Escherichia phage KBNP1711 TaxID=1436889 RepID=W6ASK4_9CAUD|nr:tail fiber protein [Escherichia phage KBNP1711]AHI60790.1 putative tail fiber protein [Escherichia phage KBNP1711]
MSRELMPKSGIMMPHVVINRDAAVVGVSTIDGIAGAVDLTGKYLQKTDAADTYLTKTDGATKTFVTDAIGPIMSGALFKDDPVVANDVAFRSGGANGVESVDMIKVTPENTIKLGSYASSVQGVEIHSAGRLQVVDQNDSGIETKYPVYSKRYRPEIEDLPFAAIGSYVKDSKGRTVGVTRTGINSDIKQLTQKVTFTQPVTVADAVGDYDAVTLRQLKNQGGGSGGPTMSGISNFGIGDFHLRDSRAFIPAFEVVSDGQLLNRADYPDLWAYAQLLTPISDSLWLEDPYQRGRYSTGDGSTTFRVPDRNGIQPNSLPALYGRGDGGASAANGQVFDSAAPDIIGSVAAYSAGTYAQLFGVAANAFESSNAFFPQGTGDTIPPGSGPVDGRYNTIEFKASRYNGVYGRSNTEIMGRNFVGVWTIRAHGGFTAANTSWSVINSDTVLPNTGTSINGGSIISEYKVGTNVEGSASFKMAGAVGAAYSARITVSNKTSGSSKTFDFLSDGDLSVPGSLLTLEGNVDAKSQLISRGGRIVLVGNNDQSQSFIEFNSNNGYTVYGRFYSERDGDITLSTSTAGANQKYFQFLKDGSATSSGGWINSSDIRIKENIEPIKNPLDKMRNIKGVSWKLKNGGKVGFGFIAQDVEVDFPDAISVSGDMEMADGSLVKDVKSVNTYGVAAALHHEAILELMKQVEDLKKEVSELKSSK